MPNASHLRRGIYFEPEEDPLENNPGQHGYVVYRDGLGGECVIRDVIEESGISFAAIFPNFVYEECSYPGFSNAMIRFSIALEEADGPVDNLKEAAA
ncbi:MAG: hypothetical protein ACREUA_09100 [Burkholderiales bacterium]